LVNHPDDDAKARDDEMVFAALYPGLRRFAAAVGPVEVDPDDLVQEALVRALAFGPLSELRDPGAYVRTIVVRLASNHRRTLGRRRSAFRLLDLRGRQADAYPSDLDDLGALSSDDRAVVYLSVIEGATADEIAVVLGWTAGRVRMSKHRALRRLRVDLESDDV
jgi:DNA-directed RNA polymerase specialized sigma24 family protein